jgi:hypothetical protein
VSRRPWTGTSAALLLGAAALAGCSHPGEHRATTPTSPATATSLNATLTSPVDIALSWRAADPQAAGEALEFATDPKGPYTLLQYLPAGQDTFKHANLIPQTPFYYRLRSYYGTATAPVTVNLPPGGPSAADKRDDNTWAAPRTIAHPGTATHPLADTGSAPTDLEATVKQANGLLFTWTDHSSDEDGFLVEDRPAGAATYRVVAVLDPGIDSFGLTTLADEKHASYRIRAFRYGTQSNTAHLTTGKAPAGS